MGYHTNGGFGSFLSELRAKWLYDLLSDRQQITSTFAGGGTSFVTSGSRPARSSLGLGARIALATRYNIELSLDYDFEIREDFHSHSGYVNVRYSF
jgi:outer membrane autotransporter protein